MIMCKFWSAIVKSDGEVLFDEMSDRHEDIITKFGIKDEKEYDYQKCKFVRVEINPPNDDVFTDVDTWSFKLDIADGDKPPIWWKKGFEKKCFIVLKQFADKAILNGKEIKSLGIGRYWIKDCRVAECTNALIVQMRGSSKIGVMRESSKIGVMRESSNVGVMWGSSNVGEMRGSSNVGVMWGSSNVGEMRGSSKIGVMRESSKIDEMWESSNVDEMWESSNVGVMWGSSKIGVMWESSNVDEMLESSNVGEMRESSISNIYSDKSKYKLQDNSIAILRYTDVPKIIVANKKIKIEVLE